MTERAENVWEKYLKIIDFLEAWPKSKQLSKGRPGNSKSDDTLLKKANDLLVPVKLTFFQEVIDRLNYFLVTFQTNAPMVLLLVDRLEEIVRFYFSRFILPVTVEKVNSTIN